MAYLVIESWTPSLNAMAGSTGNRVHHKKTIKNTCPDTLRSPFKKRIYPPFRPLKKEPVTQITLCSKRYRRPSAQADGSWLNKADPSAAAQRLYRLGF
jgi:hypothetical protein